MADISHPIHQVVRPAPTGYNYIGWIFSGSIQGQVDGNPLPACSSNKLHLSGQIQYQEIEIVYSGKLGHILAECRATGLYQLTGIPGEQIHARSTNIDTLSTEIAAKIDPVLENTNNNLPENAADRSTHRVEVFQRQLCSLIEEAISVPEYISIAVQIIENAEGNIRIADVLSQLNVSPRQLRRNFKKIVGVTPKYFAKVLQMNKLLQALYRKDNDTLSKIGQEAGFYDQAHFINVMQQFFLVKPTSFSSKQRTFASCFSCRISKLPVVQLLL